MTMEVKDEADALAATYTLQWGGRVHSLRAVGTKPPVRPAADSLEHWFKEHSWGYGTLRRKYGRFHPKNGRGVLGEPVEVPPDN